MDRMGEGLEKPLPSCSSNRSLVDLTCIDKIMAEKISIEGQEIAIRQVNNEDYISLTHIANLNRPNQGAKEVVRNWLGNNSTVLFIEEWEMNFNPEFNGAGFRTIKDEALKNSPNITPKFLKEHANCMGVYSVLGRGGGIYAHVDLAFEFAMWIEPKFKVKLIRDYKRLRSEEAQRQRLEWNAGRELARLNYPIQTAAIKEVSGSLKEKDRGGAYANEADLINELVFGMTAKQWRTQNPNAKGNLRDNATTLQNVLIANLENLNAYLLKNGASYEARRKVMAKTVEDQTDVLNQKYLSE